MDRFGLPLSTVVFFLFPVPLLLSFAVEHGWEWTGYVAYVAVAVAAAASAGRIVDEALANAHLAGCALPSTEG